MGNNNNDHTHPGASAEAAIFICNAHAAVEGVTGVWAPRQVVDFVPIASIAKRINPPDCAPNAHRGRGARRRSITDRGTAGRPGTGGTISPPLHRRGRSLVNEEIYSETKRAYMHSKEMTRAITQLTTVPAQKQQLSSATPMPPSHE